MPVKNTDYEMEFDFATFRKRISGAGKPVTVEQIAATIGISGATWHRAEKLGKAQKYLIWACQGVELTMKAQRDRAAAEAAAAIAVPVKG